MHAAVKGEAAVKERVKDGRSLASLGGEWLEGVLGGTIAKRRGKAGSGYSSTTLSGYQRSWSHYIEPEFGAFPAAKLDEVEWQMWVDRLSREGLSRSRIANHMAVVSAIYSWASRPSRRYVPRNPTLAVEMPPNDEEPRLRVALADEAERLLGVLTPSDRVPYALGFYAGLRRAEVYRLDWQDVDLKNLYVQVRKAKSEAGRDRRPPMAEPLRVILLEAHLRAGRPERGPVSRVSVISGKLQARADAAWAAAGAGRLTLHDCRHTYASLLMAAGYTLKEHMEYMGHADLQMTQRYVKLLPQPGEKNCAERLNNYLRRAAGA